MNQRMEAGIIPLAVRKSAASIWKFAIPDRKFYYRPIISKYCEDAIKMFYGALGQLGMGRGKL